jgi:membrane protease YdiL (CAAX protease family)
VLIAALVVAFLRDGLAGLKAIGERLIRWHVAWYWYALAVAVPLAVNFATVGLTMAGGAPAPHIDQLTAWYGIPMAIGLAVVNPTGGPLSEEPSFRGFALPILQNRRSPLAAGAIMAVLVTGWHAPLFFLPSFDLSPLEALTTVAVTFWYTWLFGHAGGSALVTLIAHATEGSINVDGLWPAGADASREVWVNLLSWTAVVGVLLVASWRFWTSRAPDAAREPGRRPHQRRRGRRVGAARPGVRPQDPGTGRAGRGERGERVKTSDAPEGLHDGNPASAGFPSVTGGLTRTPWRR